jgi:uncharacterized membrane protein (UPF0127 family)
MRELYVDVAENLTQHEQGLRGVKSMADNKGMLFKYRESNRRGFWMVNTYIPLDIAFVSADCEILQIEELIPHNTKPVYSNDKFKYALEANKGWFEKNDIRVGDKINIGGMGSSGIIRFAQQTPQTLEEDPNQPELNLIEEPMPEEAEQGQPEQEEASEPTEPPASDFELNKTFKQRFQRLNAHNKLKMNVDRQADMLVFYQTEEYGIQLLPRVCRGPFSFEGGVNGQLVRLLDVSPVVSGVHPNGEKWTCEPGEKTFLIDNILHVTEVLRNDPTQDISEQIVAWYKEKDRAPQANQQYMDFNN